MSTTDASNTYAQADEYIQYKLQKARQKIKWADLLTAGLLAAVLLIGYVLVFTILDHWVVSGGFSSWTRAMGLAVVLLLCAIIVVRYVVMPWFKTIHPLYAARLLDSSDSGLRGDLVSLVDLKSGPDHLSDSVRSVMEKRAAVNLADVNVDEAIDQSWLMKLGATLFILVVLTSIYAIASPKGINLLRPLTVANAAVATQTRILKVDPGTTTIAAGESLEVAVDVGGFIPEEVILEFTTSDKTYVNEAQILSPTESGSKFQTIILGDSDRGLRQDFSYRILAGDAVSETFTVTVDQPPTANVLELNYDYPSYMMMPRQETADGNIAAWEGTRVQLVAEASVPIKRAVLKFSDTSTFDVPAEEVDLIVQEQQILGEFTLELRDDRTSPRYYRIEVQDYSGRIDPQPTVYAVNIRPDKAPVVKLLDPIRDLNVPANAIVPLLVQAEDPDFMLRNVKLEFDVNGEIRTPEILYDGTRTALTQKWTGRFEFRLEDLEVKAGDVINYRVTARDNKPPLGTMSESSHLKLSITQKTSEEEVQKRLERDRQMQNQEFKQQQEEASQQEENSNDQPQAGESQTADGREGENQQGADQKQSNDPGKPNGNGSDSGKEQGQQDGENGNEPSGENQSSDPNQPQPQNADGNQSENAQGTEQNQQNQNGEVGEEGNTAKNDGSENSPQDGATGEAGMPSKANEPGNRLNPDQGEPGESGPSRSVDDDEAMQKLLDKYRNENGGIDPPSQTGEPNPTPNGKETAEDNAPQDGNQGKENTEGTPNDSTPDNQAENDQNTEQSKDNGSQQDSVNNADPEKGASQQNDEAESAEENSQAGSEQAGSEQQGSEPKPGQQDSKQSQDPQPGDPGQQKDGDPKPGEQGQQQGGDPKSGEQGQQKGGDPKSGEQGQQKGGDPKPGEQGQQNGGDAKSGEQGQQKGGDAKSGEQDQQKGGDPKSGEQGQQKGGDPKSGEQDQQKGGDPKSGEQGQQKGGDPKSGEQGQQKGGEQKGGEQKTGEQGAQKGGQQESAQPGQQQDGGKPGEQQSGTASGQKGGMGAKGGSAGPQGNSEQMGAGDGTGSEFQSDSEDVRSSAEAADLVLKRLKQDLERGEVDQELLKELGWTQDQLKQFNSRMRKKLDSLKTTDTPASQAEQLRRRRAEELLKSLDLKGNSADRLGRNDRDVEQQDTTSRRSTPPARYKDWMEMFQRGLSKGKTEPRE